MATDTEPDEDMVSRPAMELMGQLLEGSMAESQSIIDQLLESKDRQVKQWAKAYADLYDRVYQEEFMSRRLSHFLDRSLWTRDEASSVLNPGVF